jgi:hypothetical protein
MKTIKDSLNVIAISSNIIFILWILYNGVNEGFQGTLLEQISYIGLMALLTINSFLLYSQQPKH